VLYLILVVGGLVVGFVTGRWWALAAAGALAVWTATASEVEVPGWYLGLAYGLLSGAGAVVGVLARKSLRKAAEG
jgi:hypothetical protein